MAFSTADFQKIWASTSPLTPYEFTETNYKEGWNFVGSTPPARQMWDSVQKLNDEKNKWLYDSVGTINTNLGTLNTDVGTLKRKIQCGSVDNISATNNALTTNSVTFDTPFTTTPIVTCTMTGMSSGGVDNPSKLQIYTNSVSTTGFTIRIYNSSSATYTIAVHWVAVQP